ncbi:DUF4376 domain-containing protein [Jannaschia sp. M317]|uniref:DUF4376 domain-containing protein n=1 Tax=Jannaschia sp. M317 TaxID=2867011 RepID=UPI0021A8F64C|nr:DUF4376 domain-containing protein [Jannaschia sp. M317]UWQ16162.1 DUF4376 domain-containing protein [Jannaschia sp. M317]
MNIDFTQIITAEDKATADRARLSAAVNAERDRRIAAGQTVFVPGLGPVPMQGRIGDMQNLLALFNAANLRKARGDTSAGIVFRDAENVVHRLTPDQMIALYVMGATWVEAVYGASWRMKDGGDVPADFTDDRHWPQ